MNDGCFGFGEGGEGRRSNGFRLLRRVASSAYFGVGCGEEKGEGAPEDALPRRRLVGGGEVF